MLPKNIEGKDATWLEPFFIREVDRYNRVIERNMNLYGHRFEKGILSYEIHVWDRAYKRIIVDAFVCLQFDDPWCKESKRDLNIEAFVASKNLDRLE